MSTPPLVSVVTVCMNSAATIADTIDSVAQQTADFSVEHILIDGGSTDSTRRIIDERAANGADLKRIYERDRGIFDAMNKGLRAAEGEYVFFLNSDDFLASRDTLARALGGLEPGSSANPDLIAGDVSMGTIGRVGVWRHRRVPRLIDRLRGWGLFPNHQGRFVKRRLLDAVGGFNEELRLAADTTQYYDLERLGKLDIRLLRFDVAYMRAGGAANGGIHAIYRGTRETYRHLRGHNGTFRSGAMTCVKTLQSLLELRYGRCPQERWFDPIRSR